MDRTFYEFDKREPRLEGLSLRICLAPECGLTYQPQKKHARYCSQLCASRMAMRTLRVTRKRMCPVYVP